MESNIFVCGGRLGDVIHNLLVIKHFYELTKTKGILYITNDKKLGGDKFSSSIEETYNDIKPFILHQEYIEEFYLLPEGERPKDFNNLNRWRRSPLFMKLSWIDILQDLHKIVYDYKPWIKFDKVDYLSDIVLIHRSVNKNRHTDNFPWKSITINNKCKFITCDKHEWDQFPFKDNVDLLLVDSFSELVKSINSCKFFIGNMSLPLAIAHSIGKPHLAELIEPDGIHYEGDKKFIDDFFYIKKNREEHIYKIDEWIKIKN